MSASDDADRADDSKASGQPSPADRARRRRWVPVTAALLTYLIGLADILNILRPDLVSRLHRLNAMIPGTLNDVTRSADVLIGLMLLMLAHGLRRRQLRAWQDEAALLASQIALHLTR